ncbi:uncharacterized protein K489DRAFT_250580 [Dissoconium aciculare CBS 342.82]|uniref:Uncharacterized protein n=1 Tax=Dissoconium aciculare CBS 342.82 TaxID=1314786 RepID=A0A6J3M0Z7_9PEZI|nr:uncharacterized protein K489DRAFT_250580 [Dissoconium aciculare CBS 342.82]KAF1821553.1 hypothetical protein K489DRAFT_250580 [Dissoconium aciculare CBS 342.82]
MIGTGRKRSRRHVENDAFVGLAVVILCEKSTVLSCAWLVSFSSSNDSVPLGKDHDRMTTTMPPSKRDWRICEYGPGCLFCHRVPGLCYMIACARSQSGMCCAPSPQGVCQVSSIPESLITRLLILMLMPFPPSEVRGCLVSCKVILFLHLRNRRAEAHH